MKEWQDYQAKARDFFRSFGFPAETDVSLHGARASHALDVVIRPHMMGLTQLWIVECKFWNRAVSKQPVLALQQIAADLGADRAFLLSESGFQSGSLEAAENTNTVLTSLDELTKGAEQDFLTRYVRPTYLTTSWTDEGYGGAVLRLRLWRADGTSVAMPISCTLVHRDGRQWTCNLDIDDIDEDGAAEIDLHHFLFEPPDGASYRVVWRTSDGPVTAEAYVHPSK